MMRVREDIAGAANGSGLQLAAPMRKGQQLRAALTLEHLGASSRQKSFPVCAKERRHAKHSSVESIARADFGAYISRSAYISLWCVYIYPWGAVVRFGAPTGARGCEPARAPPVPAAHQACRSEKTYRAAQRTYLLDFVSCREFIRSRAAPLWGFGCPCCGAADEAWLFSFSLLPREGGWASNIARRRVAREPSPSRAGVHRMAKTRERGARRVLEPRGCTSRAARRRVSGDERGVPHVGSSERSGGERVVQCARVKLTCEQR